MVAEPIPVTCIAPQNTGSQVTFQNVGRPPTLAAREYGNCLADASRYIHGYEHLAKLGVGFYPVNSDKSPAVEGKLDRAATAALVQRSLVQRWSSGGSRRNAGLLVRRWTEHRSYFTSEDQI